MAAAPVVVCEEEILVVVAAVAAVDLPTLVREAVDADDVDGVDVGGHARPLLAMFRQAREGQREREGQRASESDGFDVYLYNSNGVFLTGSPTVT